MLRNLFKKKEKRMLLDADASIGKEGQLTETFGIRIYDGSVAPFAKQGEQYPFEHSYTFSTTEDFQDQITLEFYRGLSDKAVECKFLGRVQLSGFALAKAEEPLVRLYFSLANNQIAIWAKDEVGKGEIAISLLRT